MTCAEGAPPPLRARGKAGRGAQSEQVAMLHGVNTLLVRNNVNCCITAGKLRDERNELG